jgi:hypothetical protein
MNQEIASQRVALEMELAILESDIERINHDIAIYRRNIETVLENLQILKKRKKVITLRQYRNSLEDLEVFENGIKLGKDRLHIKKIEKDVILVKISQMRDIIVKGCNILQFKRN